MSYPTSKNKYLELIPPDLKKKLKEDPYHKDWHLDFVKYLCLPRAMRPSPQWLQGKFNISKSGYHYWLNHPRIIEVKSVMTKLFFSDWVPDVLLAVRNEALNGNEKAAKLFLDYVKETGVDEDQEETIVDYEEVQLILKRIRKKKI